MKNRAQLETIDRVPYAERVDAAWSGLDMRGVLDALLRARNARLALGWEGKWGTLYVGFDGGPLIPFARASKQCGQKVNADPRAIEFRNDLAKLLDSREPRGVLLIDWHGKTCKAQLFFPEASEKAATTIITTYKGKTVRYVTGAEEDEREAMPQVRRAEDSPDPERADAAAMPGLRT